MTPIAQAIHEPKKGVITGLFRMRLPCSAGGNAVNMLIDEGIDFNLVELIAANTDDAHLRDSLATIRIRLGENLTYGFGTRGIPEIGRKAAEESINEISIAIAGADLLFVTAGMGGGIGTGAAAVVASIAKEMGILTVGVVTTPYAFEGEQRMRTAEDGIHELRKYVETLIIIQNQRMFETVGKDTPMKEVFIKANEVLLQSVRSVSSLISKSDEIMLDPAIVHNIMSEIYRSNSLYCHKEE